MPPDYNLQLDSRQRDMSTASTAALPAAGPGFRDGFDEFTGLGVPVDAGCNVSLGNDAEEPAGRESASVAPGDPSSAPALARRRRLRDVVAFATAYWIWRHRVVHRRPVAAASSCQHLDDQNPIRDDTDELFRSPRLDHGNRTDICTFHDLGDLENRVAGFTTGRVWSHDVSAGGHVTSIGAVTDSPSRKAELLSPALQQTAGHFRPELSVLS
jgi:hypothetical protein